MQAQAAAGLFPCFNDEGGVEYALVQSSNELPAARNKPTGRPLLAEETVPPKPRAQEMKLSVDQNQAHQLVIDVEEQLARHAAKRSRAALAPLLCFHLTHMPRYDTSHANQRNT
jgi:hypothetical protein